MNTQILLRRRSITKEKPNKPEKPRAASEARRTECSEAKLSGTPNFEYELERLALLEALKRYRLNPFDSSLSKRFEIIRDALHWHRGAFSHFVTVSYKTPVTLYRTLVDADSLLQRVPGIGEGRFCRTFVSICLEGRHLASTVQNGGYMAKIDREDHQPKGDPYLISYWHFHALVGGIHPSLSTMNISELYNAHPDWDVCLKSYDGSPALVDYISDPTRGNLFSQLQLTTDKNLFEFCEKRGIDINFRNYRRSEAE